MSEHTYCQVQEEMQIPSSRLHLIHHGISPIFKPSDQAEAREEVKASWGIEGPYLLFVGKLQQIQNVNRLLEAFARFRLQHSLAMKLILVGRPVESISNLDLTEFNANVVQLGYVSSDRLPALYQGAEMMMLPSLFESFGLPVLEAMSCGTPVVASPAGALPEICGDAARYVDPLSVDSIAASMGDVFQSAALRPELRAKGFLRTKEFSWDTAARKTIAV